MDNKKTYIMIIAAVLILVAAGGYFKLANDKLREDKKKDSEASVQDEKKFKKEYESLNGQKKQGKDDLYMQMDIDTNNRMKYATQEEILKLLENGTGIIYFGFPECPWCRNAVPVLIEAAQEENVKEIYYYNAKEDRDEKTRRNGKVEIDLEGSAFYKKVLEKLGSQASAYEGLEDDSIKRLYFPTVVFVKDGRVLGIHESTVDSQTNPAKDLTKKERKELKNIYLDGITSVYEDVCDDKC